MKTVKEVSEILNVSKQTIHYHLKNLPPHLNIRKMGNKALIDDDIMSYLKNTLNKKSSNKSSKVNKQTTKDQKQYKHFYKGIYKHSEPENHQTNCQNSTNELSNKKDGITINYDSYIDKYIEHLESEIRQKNRQIDDLTIALKQEQSLNLNSQNILGNSEKIETDNVHEKENIFDSKISNQNEQKQSLFSKLFKKKN
ncbi:helix-turn-helix domain-containing protein [Staphylococcus saprophyticus]|uniref:helix-turn-helix domain-containing protein n=1 Tax=Staphylococcus saprophyticus TaxID=29385 RepID=UPI00115B0E58|nr:helix-turn-helix domain-containing protein [Staphylococcus saprophyticus]TQR88762.1 helix-turn-helix domain-containing protein [Staphylococcus saprophyticus]